MKGRAATLLLLSALALPVLAGNVYRCDAGDGITSYSNKRVAGASCKLVGSYKAQRAAKPKPRPAAPVVAAESVPANEPDTVPKGMAMGVPPATIISQPAKARTTTVAPTPAPRYDAPRLVRGQVYAYVGKDGVRNYTSVRPRGVSASAMRTIKYSYMETCYACGAKPGLNFGTLRLNTAAYQAEIAAAAREHGVEEAIVRAIIHAESAFNPRALSRVGAQGLMQLMPATARRFGSTCPTASATFCWTLSQGSRAWFWNTMARSGPGPATSRPSRMMPPRVGSSSPATRLSTVLLPQPE